MLLRYLTLITTVATFGAGLENEESKDGKAYLGQKDLLEWEAPDEVKSKYPYYLSGYDYEDTPVIIMEFGKWNTRPAVEAGGEEFGNLVKYQDQFFGRIESGYFSKKVNDSRSDAGNGVVLIQDFDGLKMDQFRSVANFKYQLSSYGKYERIFPSIAYGFIINATPMVHYLVAVTKPTLEKFMARIEVYGTVSRKWIPRLLRRIPRDQLPVAYGGTKCFQE